MKKDNLLKSGVGHAFRTGRVEGVKEFLSEQVSQREGKAKWRPSPFHDLMDLFNSGKGSFEDKSAAADLYLETIIKHGRDVETWNPDNKTGVRVSAVSMFLAKSPLAAKWSLTKGFPKPTEYDFRQAINKNDASRPWEFYQLLMDSFREEVEKCYYPTSLLKGVSRLGLDKAEKWASFWGIDNSFLKDNGFSSWVSDLKNIKSPSFVSQFESWGEKVGEDLTEDGRKRFPIYEIRHCVVFFLFKLSQSSLTERDVTKRLNPFGDWVRSNYPEINNMSVGEFLNVEMTPNRFLPFYMADLTEKAFDLKKMTYSDIPKLKNRFSPDSLDFWVVLESKLQSESLLSRDSVKTCDRRIVKKGGL